MEDAHEVLGKTFFFSKRKGDPLSFPLSSFCSTGDLTQGHAHARKMI
jgi:hypothetical protein